MHELISKFIRFTSGEGNIEKKVMDLSLSDGVLWSVYSSITSNYLVPLTIFILGSKDPAGLIVGIPLFIVPVAQYFAYHKSRVTCDLRRTTLFITFLDRVLWLPLVLLLFLNIQFIYEVIFIIAFLSLRTFFGIIFRYYMDFMGSILNNGIKKERIFFKEKFLHENIFLGRFPNWNRDILFEYSGKNQIYYPLCHITDFFNGISPNYEKHTIL